MAETATSDTLAALQAQAHQRLLA
ncbi:hypothetical protein LCGC14_2560110, partial [marine sediment metagenome]